MLRIVINLLQEVQISRVQAFQNVSSSNCSHYLPHLFARCFLLHAFSSECAFCARNVFRRLLTDSNVGQRSHKYYAIALIHNIHSVNSIVFTELLM
jgi:hypothetical protein